MATASSSDIAAFFVLWVLGILFVIWLLTQSIRVVRHAEVMIIERWGEYHTTLKPGLHFTIPFIDLPRDINWRYLSVGWSSNTVSVVKIETNRIDMREHVIDFQRRHVITKDTVEIEIDALVYYRITDPRSAVYKIQNLPDAIELLTQSTLRNIIASLTLDETFSSRETINAELLSKVHRDAERWGVTILRVEIMSIIPPHDIKNAMENQIKEERERRSTVLTADGERESNIVRSKGQAFQSVLLAEGDKTAMIQKAKGEAQAKEILSDAEASCIKAIQAAIDGADQVRAVDYLAAVQYLNAIRTMTMTNQQSNRVLLFPHEHIQSLTSMYSARNL